MNTDEDTSAMKNLQHVKHLAKTQDLNCNITNHIELQSQVSLLSIH